MPDQALTLTKSQPLPNGPSNPSAPTYLDAYGNPQSRPDTVVDIPGVGTVSFPASMNRQQIEAASAKLHRDQQLRVVKSEPLPGASDGQGPQVVIRADDGTEHVFPAGFDPKRAASIVRQRTTSGPDYDGLAKQAGAVSSAPEKVYLDDNGNPVSDQRADQVADLLAKAPIGQRVRADAWDAFHAAADEDDLTAKLQKLPMPQATKAALWDLKHQASPAANQYLSTDPNAGLSGSEAMNFAVVNGQRVPVDDDTGVGAFVSHAASKINPVPLGQMVPFPQSLGGAGYDAPVKAVKGILAAQGVPLDNAKAAYAKGDYGGAAIHLLNYMIPLLGPVLDKSGNDIRSGKYAPGLGDAFGLAASLFGPKALAEGMPGTLAKPSQVLADAADRGANSRMVDVIAPKVGANKVRFGNAAADVAPAVVRQTSGISRSAIADSVAAKLEDATAALDDAADSRLNARSYPTQPVVKALLEKRARLTSEAVQGSHFTPQSGVNRPPLGQDVVPAPNAARVAQINQAIKEVQTLGPVAKYEALRRIREAYDGPAKAVYSPAMTNDYMTAQGGKMGAADVTSVLREHLAKFDPATAKANADYSLWKKASDVLTAAEETERVRPTVGRTLMAHGLGAVAGGGIDGGLGAAVGAMVAPVVERAITGLSPAMKVVVARHLATIADALRAGNVGRAKAYLDTVQKMVPANVAARSFGVPQAAPVMGQAPETRQ